MKKKTPKPEARAAKPEPKRTEIVMIRVTTAEHRLFHDAAKKAGLQLAPWARMHLRESARRGSYY